MFLRIEDPAPAVDVDALVWGLPLKKLKSIIYLAVDEVHEDLSFALVTLELDGLHEDLDGANPQHGASKADKLADKVRLDHRQGEDLAEVCEADLYIL